MAEKLRVNSTKKAPDSAWRTPYKNGTGLAGVFGEAQNFGIDFLRGAGNASTSILDFLRSRNTEVPLGDRMFGRAGSGRDPAAAGFTSRQRALARAAELRSRKALPQEEDPGLVDQFSKYLSQAESFVPGASDWGALEQALRGRAGEHDSKLAAMYKALQGAIKADAPVISGIYDEGVSAVDESAQQASQAIAQGYDTARDSQAQMLQALGIEQAAAGQAAQGGGVDFAAQDRGDATARVAQNNQTAEDALTRNKTSALNYNTNMGNVAQMEGTEARGQLQNSLTDALTEMAFARSQEAKQRQASVYEMARTLQQQAEQGLQPDPEMLQALAEFNAEQQQLAFENALAGRKANSNVMLKLLEQTGGDQERAAQIYAEWQAAGIV